MFFNLLLQFPLLWFNENVLRETVSRFVVLNVIFIYNQY